MNKLVWLALGSFLLLGGFNVTAAGRKVEPLPAEDLFRDEVIPRLQIRIPPAAVEQLRQHPRTYVSATVREGNLTYTNVQIRLKGGPGSFRAFDDQPAFTVNFGQQAAGQKFHGLKKLHLNNSVQDPTYLSEKICRELFEAAGVPAPRAGHAVVEVNGRRLGLYVLIEGIDKHFLRRHFKDADGNLYDGHSGSDVNHGLQINSGENPEDRSALNALVKATREPDLEKRLAALQATLDVDRFLSFLAVEIMIGHWDGYALSRNNYRIFHDRAQNRLVFLPQGIDQCFHRQTLPIFPPMQGIVARSVLEVPQLRARYQERMAELLTNVFRSPTLISHVQDVGAKVQPSLSVLSTEGATDYSARVAAFGRRIQQRVRLLEQQLLPGAAPVKMGEAGMVALTQWESKVDLGSPTLNREVGPDGKPWLHLRLTAPGAGSWRTQVSLPRGHYRLRGSVKLREVELGPNDPKTGVGLRRSHQKFQRKLAGNAEWGSQDYDFEVTEPTANVELICELRAQRGDAWFDLGSLQLRRLD